MTAIIRDLPLSERSDEVSRGLERIPIKPFQIIVWVSLTAEKILELPPSAERFPVIVDTGHGHNFSIHERHLTAWAGVPREQLPRRGKTRVNGQEIPLHAGAVWIHANVPGHRDQFADQPPFRLDFLEGIALHPGSDYPRIPLLGLRALVRNKLHLAMDPERCVVHLRTPDWRTKLQRLLS
jgi:hypothetical protein